MNIDVIATAIVNWVTTNFEPIFSKNTAFNKNFGTTAGTVCEGNDSRLLSYCVQARFYTSLNPADSVTYYPVYLFAGNVTASGARTKHKVLKSGTTFNLGFTYQCTAGSNEAVSIVVANLTTATSVTVTNTLDLSVASANLSWLNNSLTYTVGDLIEITIVCPTWATNPTGFFFNVDLNFV